ncbi:digeranylgeranylglycerophospholipid reductase [Natrialba asiatica]|uniref:FAD dependent oxidoreductase n=1 Tax=Natrialba asiatica (strain ATCC 700177 / DSM 12278 / JCM 9576 / FERM P-10747 / NBRC 102637 / 172P1) TaxID=29540 RepID=M0ARV8_NATA1|nr:digeranylgeranylglycerophospholipid reductase [Natrialba asiatica]ELZ00109.1 FAD dependent oxidoreductase [Natrialba asiatica DSM 12278]
MNDRHDVVIAGAGPAGAQCARDLATRGYDVVVLETEVEEEFPRQSNKSTAGTFPSMMSAFGIPDEVVMQYTDSVVLESPTDHYVKEQSGAVLEFADFKRFLAEEGQAAGAEYRFDSRVTAPITEGDEIVGVTYNGDEEVYGEIIIDATGPAAPLAKKLGVTDLKRENHAIGIEYEFEGIDVDRPGFADLRDAMMLRLDHEIAPGGYSWIFHTGEDTAKVGLCYIQNESHAQYARDGFSIDDYLDHWVDTDPRFQSATRLEEKQHRGSAHIQMPSKLHTDRFMAIGDTVPTVDPLWGEGINKCMQSGRMAAAAADSCLKHGNIEPTAENLEVYETLWHREVAPNMQNRLWMTKLLYLADNDRYDRLMQDLNRLDDDTLAKANRGNVRAISQLVGLEDVPLLAQFAKQEFGF